MDTFELVLWLALLAVLGALFVLTARRMSRLVARTRELERFQRGVTEIDTRLDGAVMSLLEQLDRLRRRSGDPAAATTQLATTTTVVREAVAGARRLRAPVGLVDRPAVIVWELERAGRALELLDHALSGLAEVRGPRELEIQTTLKRGGLNLRHARDAVHVVAVEVSQVHPADLAGANRRRPSGGPGKPEEARRIGTGVPPPDPSM